jgi:hypothetical protein
MSKLASLTPPSRFWLSVAALFAAVAAFALQLSRSPGAYDLPLHDFVEYWAAGRLAIRGDNPYDPIQVGQLESEAGRVGEPLLMWNPPWTLPFVVPFGMLPPKTAHLVWLFLNFAIVLAATDAAWRLFGGPVERRGIAWLLAFTFVPTFLTLYLGQISALLFAGTALFLSFERRGQDYRAGASTLLIAIKPHLFTFFWIALLFWALNQRRWRVLAAACVTLLTATFVALLIDPAVLSQYFDALTKTPPAHYFSPTWGTVLRVLSGQEWFGLQFLSPLPGLIWFIPMWLRRCRTWVWADRMPALLFASLLTATYGAWPFDLIILLVPLMQVSASVSRGVGKNRLAPALYFAANAVAAIFVVGLVNFFWWIWLTPALLLAYVVYFRGAARLTGVLPVSAESAPEQSGTTSSLIGPKFLTADPSRLSTGIGASVAASNPSGER